ncbi:hypothetical protein J5837_14290 [Pseudoxanthomonas helianthi]|uniref:Peptidase M56 domain-containing protein n=1 Tax=Pseudoxanthomonas helianthi TaxID=1453541 RepID=A0A940X7V4_9GAMM|nr:M56 family metallopeptidase [Pseudoxanthomonas helianthi]MBP3985579.1 hypothetical protein [Pseudoxanthomonas helianthi]
MNESLSLLMPALAGALLHFLWQGVVLGLFAALALALLRNARPQARYAVACIALLACVAWPAITLLQTLMQAGDAAAASTLARVGLDGTQTTQGSATGIDAALPLPAFDPQPWIVVLWAAGVCLLSLRMAGGLLWVRRLCRQAQAEADAQWQACVQRLAARMSIVRKVALRIGTDGEGPLTAGWWRPVVVLPAAIVARMPADLVEALIAHELAHVRRHDYLVNLLQGAVETLLFYHPVVWWLSHRIRIERELVADDLAAAALGEPRRLALALSELDRHAGARSLAPPTHYAPAAHGGHLMSRIRQLIRPERRAIGSAVALPLIGLAVAGAAFYAHAQLSPVQPDAAPPAQAARLAPAAPDTPPAPPVAPAAPLAPPAPDAAAPKAPSKPVKVAFHGPQDGYALVRKGEEGFSMTGNSSDADDIEVARKGMDSDFIWFRRDGRTWVISDADTVARARQAWASTDALGKQMEGLSTRMQPHSDRMEALGKRMEALHVDDAFATPEVRAASEQMQSLGEKMGELGQRQALLAMKSIKASGAEQERLQREQDQLSRQQEALSQQMDRNAAVLDAASKRMEAQRAPMEALGREMEDAGKPMDSIGKEMGALGSRIEREAHIADKQVRKLIDEAYASGRAQPAPTRR